MNWQKLGRIFLPDKNFSWMQTHAANPTAVELKNGTFRIFFSTRDRQNKSHIGYIEINLNRPREILAISEKPVLSPGSPESFDCDGISLGNIIKVNDRYFLYYSGWRLQSDVPWRNQIGVAQSRDGITFVKEDKPVLTLDSTDPFSLSYPWVINQKGKFLMWYGSNLNWGQALESMEHVIKSANSTDGLAWKKSGKINIPLKAQEIGISRPCIIWDGEKYLMWYSRRLKQYKIGFATSEDGEAWTRQDDEVHFLPSSDTWDNESVEYTHVFKYDNQMYMLYCGNGYGKTGFGLARAVQE